MHNSTQLERVANSDSVHVINALARDQLVFDEVLVNVHTLGAQKIQAKVRSFLTRLELQQLCEL